MVKVILFSMMTMTINGLLTIQATQQQINALIAGCNTNNYSYIKECFDHAKYKKD